MDAIGYEQHDATALVVLNRPSARNAINADLAAGFLQALARAEADETVRVIVVTGADPAFCAGVDLKEFETRGAPPVGAVDAIRAAGRLTKPSLGAVNGPVMTGGLELALGLDFLVASDRATFADTHARYGLLPSGGMTARLPRAVGTAYAKLMSLTGAVIDAPEALRAGLVTRVVSHEALLEVALDVAAAIGAREPWLSREMKAWYDRSEDLGVSAALDVEVRARARRDVEGTARSVQDVGRFSSRNQGDASRS